MMAIETKDVVVFTALAVVAFSKKTRDNLAFQIVKFYDYVAYETNLMRIPFNENAETLLVTLGSLAFYISKVKTLRKYPLSHPDNQAFFKTMVIGLLLGFLMDLH